MGLNLLQRYKITSITDLKGNIRRDSDVGKTISFLYQPVLGFEGIFQYVLDADGVSIKNEFCRTSIIVRFKEFKDGSLEMCTSNSIYKFTKVEK